MPTSSHGGLFLRLRVLLGLRLHSARAWLALVVAMRRRSRASELWIGDSHALSFNAPVSLRGFSVASEGQIIRRIGPRLMYSVAHKGFPPRVHRIVNVVSKWGRPGSLVPIFSCGEIDVRAHLPTREDATYDFVALYVQRCMELATELKADRAYFAVPPPQSEACPSIEEFPVAGTIAQRVAAFDRLRKELTAAVAATPGAELLDATDLLAGPDGAIRPELTDDGAHVNIEGMRVFRSRARELELTARP